ncbi:MAG: hypothetical protein R3D33_09555 [Hyphomicrobiaceae bacterium]
MNEESGELKAKLEDLGRRIDGKLKELHEGGISHATERLKAADLQVEHRRLEALAAARQAGSAHPQQDATLAAEVEALKQTINRWVAEIDS